MKENLNLKMLNAKNPRRRALTHSLFCFLLLFISLCALSQDLVKDVIATHLTNVNGSIFFWVQNTNNTSKDLWKTDGTTAGTQLVKDAITYGNIIDYSVV